MIKYVKGDLFTKIPRNKNIIVPHVCNNIGKWGKGFVIPLAQKWPEAKRAYLKGFSTKGHIPETHRNGKGQLVLVQEDPNVFVYNMIAQEGIFKTSNPKPIRYQWLINSMEICRVYIETMSNHNYEIHAPKFGSGLAGGNWDFIEELIEEIWCNHNIPVTIYEL
tara:strand:- start:18622 stop:19113 length:492 start_codon:yes stop_codon:yes gene_type:complete